MMRKIHTSRHMHTRAHALVSVGIYTVCVPLFRVAGPLTGTCDPVSRTCGTPVFP